MDEINKSENNGLASDTQNRKKIDESWKQAVEKEKQEPQDKKGFVPPEADFKFFITTLTLQASIALGHMANPSSGKVEKDPAQAKFLIDTLAMLEEKTKGNLTKEEMDLLENLLYELRVAYLAKEEDKPK
ncbi:MAG: DUF1844 domain-containing protein [Candidatus Omnitrophica bacterium]|nr:DUF1844 domain-containing protein [Candidatus Omnitrophota bacterium]